MVQSYLDLLTEDLLIKIIEMLTENIDKTLLSIENRIAHLDNLIEDDSLLDVIFYNHKIKCSQEIPSVCLSIHKNVKPKKMKIMVNNKICYVPYDVYDISYGYIKYEIPDKYLNSYTYLFSRYPLDNVIIILKQYIDSDFINDEDNSDYFNEDNYVDDDGAKILRCNYNNDYQVVLQSPVLKNPVYFDILREINKLYIKLSKFRNHLGPDYVLNKIIRVNKKGNLRGPRSEYKDISNYKYYNITPEEFAQYNYITTNVLL